MRYAGLSLQRLFPLRDLVLEFGPLLLLVIFLAVGRRIATAAAATTATAGVAATFFCGTATRFATALFTGRLFAVAFASTVLALELNKSQRCNVNSNSDTIKKNLDNTKLLPTYLHLYHLVFTE